MRADLLLLCGWGKRDGSATELDELGGATLKNLVFDFVTKAPTKVRLGAKAWAKAWGLVVWGTVRVGVRVSHAVPRPRRQERREHTVEVGEDQHLASKRVAASGTWGCSARARQVGVLMSGPTGRTVVSAKRCLSVLSAAASGTW